MRSYRHPPHAPRSMHSKSARPSHIIAACVTQLRAVAYILHQHLPAPPPSNAAIELLTHTSRVGRTTKTPDANEVRSYSVILRSHVNRTHGQAVARTDDMIFKYCLLPIAYKCTRPLAAAFPARAALANFDGTTLGAAPQGHMQGFKGGTTL
jgi:hypothetical protein